MAGPFTSNELGVAPLSNSIQTLTQNTNDFVRIAG